MMDAAYDNQWAGDVPGRGEEKLRAVESQADAGRHWSVRTAFRRLRYLPGLVLLLLAGLPFLLLLSEPTRFIAGQSGNGGVDAPGSVEAQITRLRHRVERLEAKLTVVSENPVLGLGGHVRLIPTADGPATLQFEGVDLEVINRRGIALDTDMEPTR